MSYYLSTLPDGQSVLGTQIDRDTSVLYSIVSDDLSVYHLPI